MGHELVEGFIFLAVEGERAVVLLDEISRFSQFLFREAFAQVAQVKLAHQPPCHGVAMENGAPLLQGEAFEGVPHRVSQVECLAYASFVGILCHDAFLDCHALAHHVAQVAVVDVVEVEIQQFPPMLRGADEAVLDHFGIAGADVFVVQRFQEFGADEHAFRRTEGSDFVLQPVEVDSRFPAYGRVDHGEQGGGDVDVGDAPFEGGGGKSSEVGDHASSEVHEQGMAGGSLASQFRPHGGECFEVLVFVRGADDDVRGPGHFGDPGHDRPALFLRGAVGEEEQFVVRATADGACQVVFQVGRDDDFLLLHNVF